jgi:hypothetical protein
LGFRFPLVPHLQINTIVAGCLLWIATRLAVQRCQPAVSRHQAGQHGQRWSRTPMQRVSDGRAVPRPLPDKSARAEGNAAGRRHGAPARQLAHCAAFLSGPWPVQGEPLGCRRRFPARARTLARRHRLFSAADRHRPCGDANRANVDPIAPPVKGWRAPHPCFHLQNE